jgi:hypothetical protein
MWQGGNQHGRATDWRHNARVGAPSRSVGRRAKGRLPAEKFLHGGLLFARLIHVGIDGAPHPPAGEHEENHEDNERHDGEDREDGLRHVLQPLIF